MSPDLLFRCKEHAPFRQFSFGFFAGRLADLMADVDAVAFHRLANYLLGRGPFIFATHHAVTDELSTVLLATGLFRFYPAYTLPGMRNCPTEAAKH